jgi:hypothetical protein
VYRMFVDLPGAVDRMSKIFHKHVALIGQEKCRMRMSKSEGADGRFECMLSLRKTLVHHC